MRGLKNTIYTDKEKYYNELSRFTLDLRSREKDSSRATSVLCRKLRMLITSSCTRRIDIISGTSKGGLKASKTNKAKYGEDFYRKIGAIGGRKSGTGGFFANRELAKAAGAKGGRISRRGRKI